MTTSALRRPRATARLGALAATIGLAGAGWAVAVPRMQSMDMGVSTPLGSFPFFLTVWVPMMAAMMLPSLAPSALRSGATRYIGPYLTVWTVVGVAVYALPRPHTTAAAGAICVAAGIYELTPLKQRFRQACRGETTSGWELGVCCVGSSIGLMLVMVAFGAMSPTWMAGATAILLAQKLLPPVAAVDITLAVAIVALGLIELAR